MASIFELLGLDQLRLSRRFKFLQSRANAHEMLDLSAVEDPRALLHRECAATLRRDAAAVAMLLGDLKLARIELDLAGKIWLHLGLAYGAFLMRLSDRRWMIGRGMVRGIAKDINAPGLGMDFNSEDWWATALSAANHPRQLLGLLQASVGDFGIAELTGVARDRLAPYRGLPLSATGLSLGLYVDVMDELQFGNVSDKSRETLLGLAISRREMIEVAQADEYHWQRIMHPAELIDFDLLALGLAARVGGETIEKEVMAIAAERGPAALLPFALAHQLDDLAKD